VAGAVVACAAAEFDGVGARVLRAELVRVTDALKLLERLCVGEDPSESDCVPEADAEADWEGDSDAEGVAEGSAVGETPWRASSSWRECACQCATQRLASRRGVGEREGGVGEFEGLGDAPTLRVCVTLGV